MELRPEFLIKTVLKTMRDTVLPAVDPDNKLATEQAQLVIGMLDLALSRFPVMFRFDRDELERTLGLVESLQAEAANIPDAAAQLKTLASKADAGKQVLIHTQVAPDELVKANFELRKEIGELITALYANAKNNDLKPISTLITSHAKEQLLRDRAFLIAQGWEADPQAIPELETLLSGSKATDAPPTVI